MHPDATSFELLTMAEVSKILHCSKAHICNLVAGRVRGCLPLPAIHMGRRTLVRREALQNWLQASERGSVTDPRGKEHVL
jgi:excisionase family DNA binding protein